MSAELSDFVVDKKGQIYNQETHNADLKEKAKAFTVGLVSLGLFPWAPYLSIKAIGSDLNKRQEDMMAGGLMTGMVISMAQYFAMFVQPTHDYMTASLYSMGATTAAGIMYEAIKWGRAKYSEHYSANNPTNAGR